MFYFPLLERIAEYIKDLVSSGVAYCTWVVVTGSLIGFGIVMGNIKAVIIGLCLWVVGGLIFGISFEEKDKKD